MQLFGFDFKVDCLRCSCQMRPHASFSISFYAHHFNTDREAGYKLTDVPVSINNLAKNLAGQPVLECTPEWIVFLLPPLLTPDKTSIPVPPQGPVLFFGLVWRNTSQHFFDCTCSLGLHVLTLYSGTYVDLFSPLTDAHLQDQPISKTREKEK